MRRSLAVRMLISATALLMPITNIVRAQEEQEHGILKAGAESIRDLDLDAPCHFQSEYRRLKANKTDPRVAFIETFATIHADDAHRKPWDPFQESCRIISDQTSFSDAFFDRAHKFFQAYSREDASAYNETVTYFSGTDGHEGVMLHFWNELGDSMLSVWAYRNQKWQDVTKEYLGPLNLDKDDFLIVPQYGHAARILTFDGKSVLPFEPKGWLVWDGKSFQLSTAKTQPGWRCPDTVSHLMHGFTYEKVPELVEKVCR